MDHDRTLQERQRTSVAALKNSGEHLLTLSNDVLDLAKIEAGKVDLNPADVKVMQWAERVVASDDRYRPVADQLTEPAKQYKSRALLQLVEAHIERALGTSDLLGGAAG
jgi:signal transduction histidine kinase